MMATNREERIRQVAYQIWEREGHPHGRDVDHWRMATEAYEVEMAGSRVDGAAEITRKPEHVREWTLRPLAVVAPGMDVTNQPGTSEPVGTRERRTKAKMATAAAAIVGAVAAVAATVAVTRRRRGTKVERAADAASMMEAASQRSRKRRTGTSPARSAKL